MSKGKEELHKILDDGPRRLKDRADKFAGKRKGMYTIWVDGVQNAASTDSGEAWNYYYKYLDEGEKVVLKGPDRKIIATTARLK